MAFLGVLVVASLFIASPVLSKKEKSYTAESCNERCHKKHGYIIIPSTVGEAKNYETTEWMTTGSLEEKEGKSTSKFLKRVTLKKSTPKKSTLICECQINPSVLDHIKDRGLIPEDFIRWHNAAPWMGRGWLRIKGIKVKFSENSKYNKDQVYPVEENQDLPPSRFDSPFQLDHHSQSFSHHSADHPFFQLDLTKFQKSLPREKKLDLQHDRAQNGKSMVENKFFEDLKYNMDLSTPVEGNQDLLSSRVENSRFQPRVDDIKSVRSASRGPQDKLSPPQNLAHHLQDDHSPPRNIQIDLQHSHPPPRDGKSGLHHATAGLLKPSDALLESEEFPLRYIPTEQSTMECHAKCQVRGGYARGGGAKHPDKIDLLVGMINDTEKVETCVCRLNFVLIEMVKSKNFDAEDMKKFEDLQDKPLISVIHWLRKHEIEVHTRKTPFFKQFLRTNSMRGSKVQNPKTL